MRRRTLIRGAVATALAPAGIVTAARAAATTGPAPAADVQGVDVSNYQRGIDYARAVGEGRSFLIAKAGGCQLAEGPYVTSSYAGHVDGARAAGLRVGHYWLSGDFLTPTAAADYFVDHLHDYRVGDVLALDVEVLDDSTRLWNDTDVSAWFNRVRERVGAYVPWFYISAGALRAGTWSRTVAAGAHLWAASWGSDNGTYPGAPDLGGRYPAWAAHQYTSVGSAGGVSPVDLNLARSWAFDLTEPTDPPPGGDALPKSTTEQDGIPGPIMWKRTQNWLRIESGYTGPIDGVPGTNTYAALQRNMRNWGYTGPIDGVMGPNSWAAVQRLAAANGYTGPIDGAMGPNSWRGFGHFINQDRWD
ncbi:GH25 family lysozyme [Streptomyces sp. NBC_00887]|uniref:GH25 family lysozyme n=1 Tax=Streptomyces sp. NBC_00887 TaxID=2975859 RepID=UPI003868C2B3|nr:GH25 family lysozyme [Streptomyces sp. NBC_00887]WSY35655.1 GH25 family lysozyme [Streptomyces sp. NBC_00887]